MLSFRGEEAGRSCRIQIKYRGGGPRTIADEAQVAAELQGAVESLPRISAVQDDYQHWADADCAPSAGKPLWLTLDDAACMHIFLGARRTLLPP